MDRATAERHVAELGDRLGLPGLALDADGLCIIALDDGALLPSLGYNPRAGALDLMLCLDRVVPTGRQLAALLDANFAWARTGGFCFATSPRSGALVVQRRCGTEDLAGGGLLPLLQGLIALGEQWERQLSVLAPEDEAPEADAAPAPLGAMVRA
jgi:hypothetical protein